MVILVLVTLPTVACTFGDVVQRLFGGSRQAADSSWLTAAADILMPAAAPDKPTPTLLNESCTLLCFGGRNCSEVHGSWPLCEDGLSDRPRPLIYSIGIGSHINFDKAVLRMYPSARIRAFDPTITRRHFEHLVARRLRGSHTPQSVHVLSSL